MTSSQSSEVEGARLAPRAGPAKAAEMKVITSTAERVAISQRETRSSRAHSCLSSRGITRSARPHIATFGIQASCYCDVFLPSAPAGWRAW